MINIHFLICDLHHTIFTPNFHSVYQILYAGLGKRIKLLIRKDGIPRIKR